MTRVFVVLCSGAAVYMAIVGDWFGCAFCGMAACLNGLHWIDDARFKAKMREEAKR